MPVQATETDSSVPANVVFNENDLAVIQNIISMSQNQLLESDSELQENQISRSQPDLPTTPSHVLQFNLSNSQLFSSNPEIQQPLIQRHTIRFDTTLVTDDSGVYPSDIAIPPTEMTLPKKPKEVKPVKKTPASMPPPPAANFVLSDRVRRKLYEKVQLRKREHHLQR